MTLGFDRARLPFTLRTALASSLALLVATLLNLDSPQWAAMTVWLVAQPTRGLLLEKSLYRAAGSVVGSAVGVGLVLLTHGHVGALVVGLVLWVGLCAGVGNVLRHFRAYGVLLAGYTAALVVLVDLPHPDHIVGIASERVLAVLIGVAVSALVSGLLVPNANEDDIRARLRQITSDTLRWSAAMLASALKDQDERSGLTEQRRLLSELAILEEMLDPHTAGKINSRISLRTVRALIAALLSLIAATLSAAGRVRRGARHDQAVLQTLAADLSVIADRLEDADVAQSLVRLRVALAGSGGAVHVALEALLQAVEALVSRKDTPAGQTRFALVFHRDWVGARAAAVRSMVAVGAVGALWWLTGWPYAPFMMIGTAVMSSLFSSFDDPLKILRFVLIGSSAGAASAAICHLWLIPLASSNVQAALLVVPFLLLTGVAMAHPRTTAPSLDYAMAFLLLVVPVVPVHGTPVQIVSGSVAAVAGIAVAMLAFRFVLPVNSAQRLRTLMEMTINELEALAGQDSLPHPTRWRARLYHRILRLVRRLDLVQGQGVAQPVTAIGGGVATLPVGEAILRLRHLSVRPDLPRAVRRRVEVGLKRLSMLSSRPLAAAVALEKAAASLMQAEGGATLDSEVLRDGAEALREHQSFFHLARR